MLQEYAPDFISQLFLRDFFLKKTNCQGEWQVLKFIIYLGSDPATILAYFTWKCNRSYSVFLFRFFFILCILLDSFFKENKQPISVLLQTLGLFA